MEQSPVRIVLADDHQIVRRGIKDFLLEAGLEVIAEAENGNDALRLIVELQPDVAVLDIRMPGQSGIEVVKAVCSGSHRGGCEWLRLEDSRCG